MMHLDRGVVVLEELSEALQNGEYRQVVDRLYPLAISSGYQRNTNLYNQTRRALRQLLQEPDGAGYWNKMERLYRDRFANRSVALIEHIRFLARHRAGLTP